MSPAREIALVVQRELLRNLRSAKGIVLALITLLGGVGTTLAAIAVQHMIEAKMHEQNLTEAHMRLAREQALTALYDADVGRALASAPDVLLSITVGTLSFAALLAALVGYDSLASELQYRGVRYFTVRAKRSSLVLGKLLGTFVVSSAMTLAIHAIAWVLLPLRTDTSFATSLAWGPRLWLYTLPIGFAWCGLVTFTSSLVKTPILALLLTCVAAMVSWVLFGIGTGWEITWLTWLHPGGFDRLLFSPRLDRLLLGIAAGLGWGAAFTGAAILVLQKRDV